MSAYFLHAISRSDTRANLAVMILRFFILVLPTSALLDELREIWICGRSVKWPVNGKWTPIGQVGQENNHFWIKLGTGYGLWAIDEGLHFFSLKLFRLKRVFVVLIFLKNVLKMCHICYSGLVK